MGDRTVSFVAIADHECEPESVTIGICMHPIRGSRA